MVLSQVMDVMRAEPLTVWDAVSSTTVKGGTEDGKVMLNPLPSC